MHKYFHVQLIMDTYRLILKISKEYKSVDPTGIYRQTPTEEDVIAVIFITKTQTILCDYEYMTSFFSLPLLLNNKTDVSAAKQQPSLVK